MIYPVCKPQTDGNERKYLQKAVKEGWVSSSGSYVTRFEEAFAKYTDREYAVTCSSGTTALILALRALNIQEGDEVIVPEFTMIACAWAVSFVGAKPVFVDCKDDLTIDENKIRSAITKKTKAIMAVHIYGRSCDMDAIMKIVFEYNLFLVEDSAEGMGIKPRGDITCFSLYANKIITSGEGGICVTNEERLAKQLRHLSSMAFDETHTFLHSKFSYNFRMSNLQAAVALAQLERIDAFLGKRKMIESWYDKYLLDCEYIESVGSRNIVWFYDCLAKNRNGLMDFLKENRIETRMFFKPMSMQPMYKNENYVTLNAYRFSLQGLYLPTYTQLEEEDIKKICEKIMEFYG